MAEMYAEGNGVPKNPTVAFRYYKLACDDGNLRGCVGLGAAYATGEGIGRDYTKAKELLEQACAKQNERGIVDIETLRKVNDDLITTIDETLRIQKEGREKRAAVESELAVLEKDLRDKVVQAATS